MVKRCIYFIKDNKMYTKTFETNWDNDNIDISKIVCTQELSKVKLPLERPCIDVSSVSTIYQAKGLATCYVKDSNGTSVKDLWKRLDNSPENKYLPPGSYDLIYLTSLNEAQVTYVLNQSAFFDMFHNPEKSFTCNAKALAALQLLFYQNKIDYILDMNMFLWWYYANCAYPTEWIDK